MKSRVTKEQQDFLNSFDKVHVFADLLREQEIIKEVIQKLENERNAMQDSAMREDRKRVADELAKLEVLKNTQSQIVDELKTQKSAYENQKSAYSAYKNIEELDQDYVKPVVDDALKIFNAQKEVGAEKASSLSLSEKYKKEKDPFVEGLKQKIEQQVNLWKATTQNIKNIESDFNKKIETEHAKIEKEQSYNSRIDELKAQKNEINQKLKTFSNSTTDPVLITGELLDKATKALNHLAQTNQSLPSELSNQEILAVFKKFPEIMDKWSETPIIMDRLVADPNWKNFYDNLLQETGSNDFIKLQAISKFNEFNKGHVDNAEENSINSQLKNVQNKINAVRVYKDEISSVNKLLNQLNFNITLDPEVANYHRVNGKIILRENILKTGTKDKKVQDADEQLAALKEEKKMLEQTISNNINRSLGILTFAVEKPKAESEKNQQEQTYPDLHKHHFFHLGNKDTKAVKAIKTLIEAIKSLQSLLPEPVKLSAKPPGDKTAKYREKLGQRRTRGF